MVGVAGNQIYLDGVNFHEIMLSDGIVFLLFFWLFMRYLYAEAAVGAALGVAHVRVERGHALHVALVDQRAAPGRGGRGPRGPRGGGGY